MRTITKLSTFFPMTHQENWGNRWRRTYRESPEFRSGNILFIVQKYIWHHNRQASHCVSIIKRNHYNNGLWTYFKGKSLSLNPQQSVNEISKSATADQSVQHNHIINWEGARVLTETDQGARHIKESFWIRKVNNTMNRDEGTYQLSHVYNYFYPKRPLEVSIEEDRVVYHHSDDGLRPRWLKLSGQ